MSLSNNITPAPAVSSQKEVTLSEACQLSGICYEWAPTIKCVLFSESEISNKVKIMAKQISEHYRSFGIESPVLVVGLLTGALMFVTELLRNFSIPYEVDFMVVSSYGKTSTTSSGSVKLKKDLSIDPHNRYVLIVEDLIDTGNTLLWIKSHLKAKHCKDVKVACLLDKVARRTVQGLNVEFIGFECPDEFVVGFGMDFNDQYRCLPWIGCLKEEAYKIK